MPTSRPRPLSLDGHLPVLDGVRGIAILGVLLVHVVTFGAQTHVEYVLRVLTSFGWAGVDLFFVLSGFLITGILLKARGGVGYYRAFYARRTLRIFPLYYAYCAVLFVVLPLWFGRDSADSLALSAAAPWYLTYAMNIRIALANSWSAAVLGTAFFWSLCVEEQFYLLWPWTVAQFDRARLAVVCTVMIATALAVRIWMVRHGHPFAAYVLLPARMDALAIGALAAIIVRLPGSRDRLARRAAVALAASILVIVALVGTARTANWDDKWMQTVGMTCIAIGSGALILFVLAQPGSLLARLVGARPLRFFGYYAYGMYVLGGAAELLVKASGLLQAVPLRAFGSGLPAAAWHLALSVGTTTALALLSRAIIEDPALALKRFFPYQQRGTVEFLPADADSDQRRALSST